MNTPSNNQPTKPARAATPPVCAKPVRVARTLAEHEARQQELATLAMFLLMIKHSQVFAS